MYRILLCAVSILALTIFVGCGEDGDAPVNANPEVLNEFDDITLQEGFQQTTISLAASFSDSDGDDLTYTATSSTTSVATVTVNAQNESLVITEAGTGTSTITVTASDGNGGSANDSFTVTISGVSTGGNSDPTVANAIDDVDTFEGVGSIDIDLSNVFADADGDNLSYSAASSMTGVATVSVNGSTLTVTEVSNGTTTVTVTANDGNESAVEDSFSVTISTCDNDNSLNLVNTSCDNSPSVDNSYTETLSMGMRTIVTNRVPDHDFGNQISMLGVTGLISTTETFTFTASPTLAATVTSILDENNRPSYDYGIGLNGVPIDPAPAEPFIFTIDNPGGENDGEYNWDWVFEPNNNRTAVGLDCNTAHLQPTDEMTKGLIHYHGDMVVYANSLLAGLGDGTTTPTEPVQIGWASDGFPIVYKYGPNASGTGVELLESSYELKSGIRPGDGMTEPCGEYNGKYTNDYEFNSEVGDLDECNGIERSITLTTPAGGSETFSYFYVITDEFPIIGRCISGTPDDDFSKRP